MSMQPGVAWIIGGGSGIGAAVATLLAKRGWTVAISGRREDKLAAVAKGHPTISPYPLDVTDTPAIEATVHRIAAELGRIDLFIFGAAAWQPMDVGDYDYEKFAKVVDTNYLGVLQMANPVIAQMERQGGGHFSVIASVAGYFGLPRSAAYSSTKAGLINLLETMRTELAPRHIKVRMIAPGFVKSELTDKNDFPMPFLMETDEAAKRIVDGLTQSDRFEIAFPKRMVWLMKTVRWLPYPVFFWLTSKMLPKD
ncbi:SDR family NAD(P)-dependent oxidoreductase [Devosia neptuniae]|uniref:SDR family NAD(P)-dependent oxidoreductase n=1 Tax=Devosia neptuniae TaxID=191302 RepID=UPI0022B02B94|nr:SDR family NAD(P)-dependent oxidoreductase [Devosia neptuniae]MCZ4346231.1 SDR family NAD(P)-dependent oxidoreductase [Devosia neptuniae]|tara:strand:+ start:67067 stop:67825 length:759 start_codon:yes stop_codon:yes gene_type:complete